MERLNYAALERRGYDGYLLKDAPERVLQFGEGNFLRAFCDHFIDLLNEKACFDSKVIICQPRGGRMSDVINEQEGLYTLLLRGQEDGRMKEQARVISCVSRCIDPRSDYQALLDCAKNPHLRFIISNTTEAGIVYDESCGLYDRPPASFPAKLTQFLIQRYDTGLPGFIILPCELIDRNGDALLDCVRRHAMQWDLPQSFLKWLEEENVFCSTLVDRIVPGYPKDEAANICSKLGYRDELLDTAELFATWVIEADDRIKEELPVEAAGVPVIFTGKVDAYKKRKVRILNGLHTSMAMGAYLAGLGTVYECMQDEVVRTFMKTALYGEIIPVLDDQEKEELEVYASSIKDRFGNPFIFHELLSISLNSTAKWRARVMPTVIGYYERNRALPRMLTFSFASYLSFYHAGTVLTDDTLKAARNGEEYIIRDDRYVLELFFSLREKDVSAVAETVIGDERLWGRSLKELPGFTAAVIRYMDLIGEKGMYEAMRYIQH